MISVLRGLDAVKEGRGWMTRSTISNCVREEITELQAMGAICTVLCLEPTSTVMWKEIRSRGTSRSSVGKTSRA
jgi:hypothetical protein